jgi:hypothetical protein
MYAPAPRPSTHRGKAVGRNICPSLRPAPADSMPCGAVTSRPASAPRASSAPSRCPPSRPPDAHLTPVPRPAVAHFAPAGRPPRARFAPARGLVIPSGGSGITDVVCTYGPLVEERAAGHTMPVEPVRDMRDVGPAAARCAARPAVQAGAADRELRGRDRRPAVPEGGSVRLLRELTDRSCSSWARATSPAKSECGPGWPRVAWLLPRTMGRGGRLRGSAGAQSRAGSEAPPGARRPSRPSSRRCRRAGAAPASDRSRRRRRPRAPG